MASTTETRPAEPDALSPAQVQALAQTYRLDLDVRSAAGSIGQKEGRETGASVEIQDFRDYVPGDDPRRIDWMAYGRTDRLVVRLFREEVSPHFDLIVDTSASMSIADGRKAALAAELSQWLTHAARFAGIAVRVFAAGEDMTRADDADQLAFDQPECCAFVSPRRAAAALRRSSVRLIFTDFMAPADPAAVLRAFSSGCGWLIVVHLLGPWEAEPEPRGPVVLHAIENDRRVDLHLDSKAVEGYARRLAALRAAVRDEMFKCAGLYLPIIADRTLEDILKQEFLPAGLIETT